MYNPSAPIQNQTAPLPTTPPAKPKSKLNLTPIAKPLAIVLISILIYIVSVVLSSLISSFSENIQITGIITTFNPLITIAYILIFYSVSHYYTLTAKQAYNYLLLALFLSFTINFVEGSMILVFLAPLLRKLKLIENPSLINK